MKITFFLAILFGFVGVLAAGHFVPWGAHVRLPSQTHVIANGGRAEQFLIRLPADRIDVAGAQKAGLRAAPAPGAAGARGGVGRAAGPGGAGPPPPQLTAEPLLVEHFKIRDAAGNVIGLAARHWSADVHSSGPAWSVMIPSRGALLLTAPAEARAA